MSITATATPIHRNGQVVIRVGVPIADVIAELTKHEKWGLSGPGGRVRMVFEVGLVDADAAHIGPDWSTTGLSREEASALAAQLTAYANGDPDNYGEAVLRRFDDEPQVNGWPPRLIG